MALYYLDTSALVKLYLREPGTEQMVRLAGRAAGNQLAVLSLSQVEIRSTLRRRERAGDITGAVVAHLLDAFQRHLEGVFLRQALTEAILDVACEMVDRHSLFTLDAVQLAGYLAVRTASGANTPIFVSADNGLLRAAEAERIPVLNPLAPEP
ncbi:MAG: type II toxin-antitoxin system VapC family toxin [Terriglobales bacterium]